ncbi:MAG: phosphatase PAP2 family protein [Chloroflexi bacterium]|nr:phosphatase PAP2 family protein [Chloroflexota bacterium]
MLLIAVIVLYYVLNNPGQSTHELNTIIDNWIPLVTWAVIPYVSWYLLLGITIIRFIIYGPVKFGHAALAAFIILLISCLFYAFFQTIIDRPEIMRNDFPARILKFIYRNDNPYNAFPSTHSSLSTLCIMLWRKNSSKVIYIFICVCCVMIICSTVLVKQHYFVDIIGGIIVGVAGYYLAGRMFRQAKSRSEKANQ